MLVALPPSSAADIAEGIHEVAARSERLTATVDPCIKNFDQHL